MPLAPALLTPVLSSLAMAISQTGRFDGKREPINVDPAQEGLIPCHAQYRCGPHAAEGSGPRSGEAGVCSCGQEGGSVGGQACNGGEEEESCCSKSMGGWIAA
eukprot:2747268-Rhodomonas_salina.4